MKKSIFILASAVLALTACNKSVINTPTEGGVGYLSFAMSSDDVVVSTKTVSEEDLDDYKVYLGTVEGWPKTYGDIKGLVLPLPAQTYDNVYAENITAVQAETDNGQLRVACEPESVTVVAGQANSTTLACIPQSSCLVLNYSEAFKEAITGYTFSVEKSDGTAREDGTQSLEVSEGSEVYYNGDVILKWTLTGTYHEQVKTFGGEGITLTKGYRKTLTVDMNTYSGDLRITVTANDELEEETGSIIVDPYNPQN